MTIHRREHTENFTPLANELLGNSLLSFKARGILCYLLSKPPNWKVRLNDIVKHSAEGTASVRNGIQELVKHGYIVRQSLRRANGRIAEWQYEVFEEARHSLPLLDNQQVDNLKVADDILLNTYDSKIEVNEDRLNQKKSTSAQNLHFERGSEILDFYHWYTQECYPHYKEHKHPRLKKEQQDRVLATLQEFIYVANLDAEDLEAMAEDYFQKKTDCDHNINHFATKGILEIAYYETIANGYIDLSDFDDNLQTIPSMQQMLLQSKLSDKVKTVIKQWVDYKGHTYRPLNLRKLLELTEKAVTQYGEQAFMMAVNEAMSKGYQGIVWTHIAQFSLEYDLSLRPAVHIEAKAVKKETEVAKETADIKEDKPKSLKKPVQTTSKSIDEGPLFEQFWSGYPRKISRTGTKEVFHDILKQVADPQLLVRQMMEGLERAKNSRQWSENNGQKIPHPGRWLNNRGWETTKYVNTGINF